MVENPPASARDIRAGVQSLGQEDPLEEGMAIYSSILAWRIPWTEKPGELQSMGSQRVGHDQATEHAGTYSKYKSSICCQIFSLDLWLAFSCS